MLNTKRTTQAKRAKTADLPAWATETKPGITYVLQIEDSGGEHLERIEDLDRDEYIDYKNQAAKKRGFKAPKAPR